ncbi:S1-C subfamily serine protease [Microbacteriaceae bacterium SG_E_30_P1]|uniref:S1-C subfamily serine protease n=1 Tax=Antiquaquibacter oligotrophicus TaxID=2880260 RepID=A0ABT6KLN1_9MICO|nr:MarP family serine protease [Antiquaquibacter oligotrophicus]MDH6180656.1 S1-C subfamily serine protease [Antiquaquibacter oligotrophicus]UDF13616.1 MarP family serine protease [Antiquaquibacter oligotrophicus]
MSESTVLDVFLVLVILGYVGYGIRAGLSHALFAFGGVVAGGVAAFFLVPIVAAWVPLAEIRPVVTVAVVLVLLALGTTAGAVLGRLARSGVEDTPLSGIDRLAGGLATGVAAALIASVVATSVAQLGIPPLSRAIAGSAVLRTIGTVTPDPVEAWLAQLRAGLIDSGLPVVTDAFGIGEPVIPSIDAGSPELTAAAQSVVRITGNAFACGVAQSGSGFVVSDDRVVTNAHVVAGVTEPVIETPGGQAIAGTVVYFDPIVDLAVIAVPGLDPEPLPLGDTAQPGTDAAVQGYPFGGPFTSIPAGVMNVGVVSVDDIYEISRSPREIYTLASDVNQGNSGGPVLSLNGEVIGVVFAKSADTSRIGYAATMAELDPVADAAAGLTADVSTGQCIR